MFRIKKDLAFKTLLLTASILVTQPYSALANGETTSTIPTFEQAVQNDMMDRETTFTVNYTGDANALISQFSSVVTQAEQSNDYLSLSWKTINYGVTGTQGNAHLNFTVPILQPRLKKIG